MNQSLSLRQLADRLLHVEKEVNIIRQELADLRQRARATPQEAATLASIPYPWGDKGEQRQRINRLFTELCIQGAPIGALSLQERMGQAGLIPNELNQSLVDGREE
jgi:hypothetical protein